MLENKRVLIGLIAVMLVLCFTYSAYANVMDTSLALRDKLPVETLANLPDFISRMEAMGSKVSVDASTGYYIAYNEADLKGIFGEDALLVPSPPGVLTITYKRSGTYRYWGMLHGLVVADSASKVITITKGGFISNTNLNVNIAGDEVQINARDLTRSVFKISREGVYSQNEYFMGCEPEGYISDADCVDYFYEDFDEEEVNSGPDYAVGCSIEQMTEYEDYMKERNICILSSLVLPQNAYANITGYAFISENRLLKEYRTQEFEDFRNGVLDLESIFLHVADIRNVEIEAGDKISLKAIAPAGGEIEFGRFASREQFRYSLSGEQRIKAITGDKLDLYIMETIPVRTLLNAENVGNTPHASNILRVFEGFGPDDEFRRNIMQLNSGKIFSTISLQDYNGCKENKPIFNGFSCIYKEMVFDDVTGESSYKYHIKVKKSEGSQKPLVLEMYTDSLTKDRYGNMKDITFEIEPFDVINDAGSSITLVNDADTAIKFTKEDIIINPAGNDWTELGISFKASISIFGLQGAYDTLDCRLAERKCYLNGREVMGFVGGKAARSTLRCSADSECYENQKCIQSLCVTKATCNLLPGQPYIGGYNKANVLIISDGYDLERPFQDDAKKTVDLDGINNGIFSVEPFSTMAARFEVSTIFGGTAPSMYMEGYGMVPWERYVDNFIKQCPATEYAVLLSKNDFRSFAKLGHTGIAEKGTAWVSVGAVPTDFPLAALHEFGHAFGYLWDEYYERMAGTQGNTGTPNCLSKIEALKKWKQWPDLVADAQQEKWKGCGGPCDSSCANLIRPSDNSIMNNELTWLAKRSEPGWKAFNAPSEAQLIEKLNAYS